MDEDSLQVKRPKFNSAFRLCYSLQLVPCHNEKHQLIAVYPRRDSNNNNSSSTTNITWDSRCRCWRSNSSNSSSSSSWQQISPYWERLLQRVMENNNTDRGVRRSPSSQGGTPAPGSGHSPNSHLCWSIMWVPVIFSLATVSLYLLSHWFVDLEAGKSFALKFPTSIEDITQMSSFLLHMKETHLAYLLLVFCAGFIYKQTFAIPGSVFLNLLAGALFGPYLGFLLASPLTALGATNCYLLSRTFGRSYVTQYFPERVKFFQEKVEENKDSLFFFLLFLRLFPMSPNWFMNVVAPLVGIPIHLFFLSVLIGLMPYNFICVQTGSVLSEISSVSDVFSTGTMLKMSLAALAALLPGLVIKKLHKD
ncbi:transmembrane protein 41A [Aplysia californica]|uniref:Transmembrane protein 41A n=1 Tax=Aplysia californica TaxID=6500 RepID=A0ABM0JCJ8_APLCA|nr:transmembrane protein 41A [Aplysia californica]